MEEVKEVKINLEEFLKRVNIIADFLKKDKNLETVYVYFENNYGPVMALKYEKVTKEMEELIHNISFPNMYKETGMNLRLEIVKECIYNFSYVFYDRDGEVNRLRLNKNR